MSRSPYVCCARYRSRKMSRFLAGDPSSARRCISLISGWVLRISVETTCRRVLFFRPQDHLCPADPSQISDEPNENRDHHYEGGAEDKQEYRSNAQRILLLQGCKPSLRAVHSTSRLLLEARQQRQSP